MIDDGLGVNLVDVAVYARYELSLGSYPDALKTDPGHLTKEALDQIQPRAVFWGEDELKAPWVLFQVGSGLLGDMA